MTKILQKSNTSKKYFKLYVDIGKEEKNSEKIFDLEIIAFELVALNTRFY